MAKLVIVRSDCETKISPNCFKVFDQPRRAGRPWKSCPECRMMTVKPVSEPTNLDRECPCGAAFKVTPGRGKKATKCQDCRDAGKVYRQNDEGLMEEIRAETLRREQAEKLEAAGQERAERLVAMMRPILAKRHRELIVR